MAKVAVITGAGTGVGRAAAIALAPTTADATTVTWTMESPVTFMTRIAGLFMNLDKRIGGDFEKGLAKLSALAQD